GTPRAPSGTGRPGTCGLPNSCSATPRRPPPRSTPPRPTRLCARRRWRCLPAQPAGPWQPPPPDLSRHLGGQLDPRRDPSVVQLQPVLHVGDDYDVDLPAVEHPLHLGWLGGERHYVVPAPLAGLGAGEQIG